MKAIVKTEDRPGSYAVLDVPIPDPGPGDVLVEMKAMGLCYTDVSILNGQYRGRKPVPVPMVMGHEGAGVVAKIGEKVRSVNAGTLVGLEALSGCGVCHNCRNGDKNMCSNWDHLGITYDGTFAEYVRVPERLVHPLPAGVELADAAVLEPLSLVARSLEHLKPFVGESAAIIGPGSVGLLHLQALRAAGVSKTIVIGLDVDATRFEIAERLGATHVVNASRENPVETVMKITEGRGADMVIEAASSPKVWDYLLDLAAARGRISTFGLYPESSFNPLKLLRSGLTIYGDVAFLERHFMRAIEWLASGKVSGRALITKRFRLEDAGEAFGAFQARETVKCLFER